MINKEVKWENIIGLKIVRDNLFNRFVFWLHGLIRFHMIVQFSCSDGKRGFYCFDCSKKELTNAKHD